MALIPFTVDLTTHEGARLAAVLDALGPDWDPTEIYTGEMEAARRLYSGLDADQRATYEVLIASGVFPDNPEVTR
ncbi:MAG TPA: DUF6400 family protein [Pseudonocardiaceae bacterium]|nr:DUF6400 family protein [Pseudonocardiaceae bacterium]